MADCESEKTIHYEETGGIFIRTMPMPSSRKMGRRRICNA